MERTDNTLEDPFITYTNKATAIRVAKMLAKKSSFDCVKIWVNDAEGYGVWSATLPKWEG
jgi:hypothetical protein